MSVDIMIPFIDSFSVSCRFDPLLLRTLIKVCKTFRDAIERLKVLRFPKLAKMGYFLRVPLQEVIAIYGKPNPRLLRIYSKYAVDHVYDVASDVCYDWFGSLQINDLAAEYTDDILSLINSYDPKLAVRQLSPSCAKRAFKIYRQVNRNVIVQAGGNYEVIWGCLYERSMD